MELEAKIEAILFYRAEPMDKAELAKITKANPEEVASALLILKEKLNNRGISLIQLNGKVELGTNPELSGLIEEIIKEELSRDLGKAALETLTLIVYQGPISRPEIDQVRGVNSSFILRNLMIRGLVERITDEKDSRRFLYQPTLDLLKYLGLDNIENLPEYESVKQELNNFFVENNKKDGEE